MKTSLIRRRVATTTLFVACVFGATSASAKDGRHGKDRGAHMFERVDTNKDGKISKSESSQAAEARFKKMDTNGDGVITEAEIKAAHEARRAAHAEKKGKEGKAKGNDKARKGHRGKGHGKHFAKLDTNNDGKITRAEAQQAEAARFAKVDANGDGVITRGEMKAAHEKHRKEHPRGKQACDERKGKKGDSARNKAA